MKDNYVTPIIFRKFKKNRGGEIIALMPYESYHSTYKCQSYMHVGQHGDADYNCVLSLTTPATENEYSDLKKELESIGYTVAVIKRVQRDKMYKL